ncbi:YdeI/OmpD-associated family protein [Methanococcoides alaskense]|uniref:Uncharacterized protein YdeI (YjbR/CyaY-like superfamily) n=1 Tax=Methanococcoides alaskense TaxID=325778 RepID=A0AA90TXB5_9EURY|nr:YdeI/OmpD-associated family protein [Methanococcoides alaskense]MDA0525381.1 YdeI/OmpD-associated family protein [Methanococcoides alaskense]MDR6221688.1 uncharacterized protein YdeI (YjbR/CyaY-like superfamily) [Methanococcoides alaskense]
MKEKLETMYSKDREEWRSWLQKNYLSEKNVWLIYYKKHTKKLSIPYSDAVEEAICFGWIDGQIQTIDDDRYMQRFSPRTSKSHWSVINIERAKKMIKQGRMTERGLRIFQNGIKNQEIVPSSKDFSVPDDLKSALEKNKKALNNFENLAPSAKLAYVYWVNSAKKDETRQKRIKNSVELIEQNKKFGGK